MKHDLELVVANVAKELFGVDVKVELTRPEAKFSDYATNVALQLSKQLVKNPREIADALAESVRERSSHIAAVSVAGPGFLNLQLTDVALLESLTMEKTKSSAGQKILVEYSDPNPFKPLHAGHLYTTLVGDTIARLIENTGAETIRINYGGDVGLHAGKSMWAIIAHLGGEYPENLSEIPESDRPKWLGERYVEGNNAYEDDEKARTEIVACNKRVYALHAENEHDSAFAKIYWVCRQWSYDYFAVLYEQLQVTPFARYIPESEVTSLGVETVREQLAAGVYEESDGAVIFRGDEHGLHTRVFINQEGLPTYETKDVGLSLTKWQDYHFDQSIIITDNGQVQYMQVVIASIGQFAPEPAERTRHLTHGVIKLQGGVKMSSRKGNVVTAMEILEAAREAGRATGTNPSEETVLAAVKYAFAKNRIGGDIIYDPVESIALEGNSGPYLQYAHARARSILVKATSHEPQDTDHELQVDERTLVRKLTEYPEVIEKATFELMPHYVCTYLYELAQEFNRFYEKNRVIGDDRERLRLELVDLYATTLKQGLTLLGIHAPERM
ncbi:arginine--tRNA ligase [Candidatus Saccharibacteria bacterium]|nr:MAG: arginine--tRNA ligase [Candidatus Saccharibacteria bacterium]